MLHHKHFDCNYGAMHVPLDYLFGTYAGSKEEVRYGALYLAIAMLCRFQTYGRVKLLEKRQMIHLSMKQAIRLEKLNKL